MAANIETMMYHNAEVPWHGLGTPVNGLQTAADAIKAAGLDWEVEKQPVYLPTGIGEYTKIPFNAIVRKTDNTVYQVAADTWEPLQNAEAFTFFDRVVGEGKAMYDTAGALGHGERIWILAKLPEMSIAGDEIKPYILLVNAHDGTLAWQMFKTATRVVCQNTLSMAMCSKKESQTFYARHTRGMTSKVTQARDTLGITLQWFSEFAERAERMTKFMLPAPDMKNYVKYVLNVKDDKKIEDAYQPTRYAYAKIQELAEVGKGNDKFRGTAWAAFNGCTEFIDHYRDSRSHEPNDRLASVWFGSGAQMRTRAWDYLSAISKN
jgi:phage/plasmid-like protein (TIGR03299 family)